MCAGSALPGSGSGSPRPVCPGRSMADWGSYSRPSQLARTPAWSTCHSLWDTPWAWHTRWRPAYAPPPSGPEPGLAGWWASAFFHCWGLSVKSYVQVKKTGTNASSCLSCGIFTVQQKQRFCAFSFLLTQWGSSKESTRGTMCAELRISSNTLRKASSYSLNSGSIRISLSSRTKWSTNPGCL